MIPTTRRRVNTAAVLVLLACPAWAADLALPSAARQTAERSADPDSYRLPVDPWTAQDFPVRRLEGAVTRAAWRVDGGSLTTLQLLEPLRAQLLQQGYSLLFECSAQVCGGFDFRFNSEILPAPAMYVDITDYRYLAAESADASRHVSVLVSRSAAAGFVQIVQVAPTGTPAVAPAARAGTDSAPVPQPLQASGPVAEQLVRLGHAVLAGLSFASGSSDLSEGAYDSLEQLAAFLRDNPGRRVALVGHTDAVGSLEGNIALSRRRAASVRERLTQVHGIPPAQIEAQGAGYLSPLASNDIAEGREANRRVEVVLLPE